MKNKTKKEIKKLSKAVSEVRKENAKLTRKLEKRIEAVERQAGGSLEETGASHPQAEAEQAQEAREVTDAAARKAGELDVDLSEVRGTGSGGRVLVKDVDLAAQERAGGAGS